MDNLIKMKTRILFPIICLLTGYMSLMFVSCVKEGDEMEDNREDTLVNLAPKNVIGNTLTFYNSKLKVVQKAYGFTSGGSCIVPMLTSDYTLLATPKYSYVKESNCKAFFQLQYTYRLQISSDYTNTKVSITTDITYTSESGGTFSGTETDVSTSNVSALNGTSTRIISGTFVML